MHVRSASPVHQRVARDLKEPRARMVQCAEASTLPQGLDEHVLQHIVGRRRVGQSVKQIAAQLALMQLPRSGDAGTHCSAPRSYQPLLELTILTTISITGTSISTPTTVARAAPDSKPNRLMAAATASSKKLLAPISAEGQATLWDSPSRRFSQ